MEPVSVAEKVGVTLATGLLFTSRRVTVTVEVELPFATTGPEPVIVEVAATADPATNVTVPVTLPNPAGVEILRVFAAATVEAIVPVATPEAFVVEPG